MMIKKWFKKFLADPEWLPLQAGIIALVVVFITKALGGDRSDRILYAVLALLMLLSSHLSRLKSKIDRVQRILWDETYEKESDMRFLRGMSDTAKEVKRGLEMGGICKGMSVQEINNFLGKKYHKHCLVIGANDEAEISDYEYARPDAIENKNEIIDYKLKFCDEKLMGWIVSYDGDRSDLRSQVLRLNAKGSHNLG